MDKNKLLSAGQDNLIHLWDLQEGICLAKIKMKLSRFIPLAVDAHYFYTYSAFNRLLCCSLDTGKVIKKIKCNIGSRRCALTVDN